MNIFITSDTHGDLTHVLEMYDAITSESTPEGIPHYDSFDCLIHCGDYSKDAFELSNRLGLEVYSAFGNCDDHWSPDFDILDTEAGSIVVTHGHMEDINNTHEHLYELADDQGCNCICYGHSHIPVFDKENGYLVINPGSPTKPLDGTEGSCAVLTADENGYHGGIVYYTDVEAALAKQNKTEVEVPAEEPAETGDKPEMLDNNSENETAQASPKLKKKSSLGGFLRRIFNYSDGQ